MTRAKPASCIGCACASHGTDFSAVEGTGSSGVMVVAEASGEHEQRDGLPLRPYAPAGSLFERTLRRMGVSREQLSVTNVLRCRPRNNWLENAPWEYSALNHCRPNLDTAIAERRPRCIVALGGTALRELTGMAGEARGVSHLAGYVLPLSGNHLNIATEATHWEPIPVIADFHPSFLRRGKASLQGVFARILNRAVNIAAGRDHDWLWNVDPEVDHAKLGYQTRPSLGDAESYLGRVIDASGAVLSYDIETSESASLDEDASDGFVDTVIRLVQFSIDGAGSIGIPYDGAYRGIIQRILHTRNVKCGHNVWLFDNKVLAAAGAREGIDLAPRGVIHDTLQMFHHWQPDLPAHLQFAASFVQFPFPWKHLAGTDLAFYGCADVDATLRLYGMLERTLKRDGLWGGGALGYVGQVYDVRPVLAAMESRGLPIDDTARLRLDVEFAAAQRELGAELAGRAPEACRRVHPKVGYKGVPPEVKAWVAANTACMDGDADAGIIAGAIRDIRIQDPSDDGSGEYYTYARREFFVAETDAATGEPVSVPTARWCRVYDFNPNSSQQLLAYMRARKHKVPKSKQEDANGEQKDTTAAKELMRLAGRTGDTFYLKVIEYRGLTKMRGTYVDGFAPGPDGCVHTSFTFDTGIGQLSSRNPNIQNFPKLKPTKALATAMRAMVAAKPGHIITEWDFKSCHVITLGFLAEDAQYMRLGRLDIHSFLAGHFLNLWDGAKIVHESDDELRARFKWFKSDAARKLVRDDQAKHGILGIGNGLRARGLYERYMESFPPKSCDQCARSGRVPGVRGLKRCANCSGCGFESGQRVAERVLEVAEHLFPAVFAYQKREAKRAHDAQQLISPFGHVRRFYEVFRWDSRKCDWGHGDQHEQALSFRLANIAFGHIREKLKELDRAGLAERYGLFNNVHDSYMFHFPEDQLAEHIREVHPVLVSPSTVLRHPTIAPDGLSIDVEASWGRTWADMTEISLGQAPCYTQPSLEAPPCVTAASQP